MEEKKKNVYEIVLAYAAVKHKGQKRRDGSPYIEHPMTVAKLVEGSGYTGKKYIAAALLHDVLEDTDATEEEMKGIVTDDVIRAVRLLTRGKGQDEAKYLSSRTAIRSTICGTVPTQGSQDRQEAAGTENLLNGILTKQSSITAASFLTHWTDSLR